MVGSDGRITDAKTKDGPLLCDQASLLGLDISQVRGESRTSISWRLGLPESACPP